MLRPLAAPQGTGSIGSMAGHNCGELEAGAPLTLLKKGLKPLG